MAYSAFSSMERAVGVLGLEELVIGSVPERYVVLEGELLSCPVGWSLLVA
jgi:hypothetical protein